MSVTNHSADGSSINDESQNLIITELIRRKNELENSSIRPAFGDEIDSRIDEINNTIDELIVCEHCGNDNVTVGDICICERKVTEPDITEQPY